MEKTAAAHARSTCPLRLCAFRNRNKLTDPSRFYRGRRPPCCDLAPGAFCHRCLQEEASCVSASRRRYQELRN